MNSTDEEAIRSTAFKVEYWHIDPMVYRISEVDGSDEDVADTLRELHDRSLRRQCSSD
jgi:hypothetical protein